VRALELGTEPIDLRNFNGEFPKADFTAVVPTQLFRALNGDDNLLRHLQGAKAVLVGGAQLTSDLQQKAIGAEINVVTTYGMTETTGGCVYNGTPLQGVEISITSENRVAIKGRVLAMSYLGAQALWESQCIDGWFHSTDIGIIENGKLIVEGRIDDVIISGGENISLAEVERIVSTTFSGIDCAAFAVPDSQWGQSLQLAIAGDVKPEQSAINEYLSSQISKAAKVKNFLYVSQLPRTALGKIDRRKLAELATEANHG
jgi:O-succinylbenzoic acid--CoA ligase